MPTNTSGAPNTRPTPNSETSPAESTPGGDLAGSVIGQVKAVKVEASKAIDGGSNTLDNTAEVEQGRETTQVSSTQGALNNTQEAHKEEQSALAYELAKKGMGTTAREVIGPIEGVSPFVANFFLGSLSETVAMDQKSEVEEFVDRVGGHPMLTLAAGFIAQRLKTIRSPEDMCLEYDKMPPLTNALAKLVDEMGIPVRKHIREDTAPLKFEDVTAATEKMGTFIRKAA